MEEEWERGKDRGGRRAKLKDEQKDNWRPMERQTNEELSVALVSRYTA